MSSKIVELQLRNIEQPSGTKKTPYQVEKNSFRQIPGIQKTKSKNTRSKKKEARKLIELAVSKQQEPDNVARNRKMLKRHQESAEPPSQVQQRVLELLAKRSGKSLPEKKAKEPEFLLGGSSEEEEEKLVS